MSYPDAAWERAMTVQEVLLKAISGEIHWFRAAEILGWSPRTVRRWRERYEAFGYAGLVDKRLYRPSIHRAPPGEVERILRLYKARYGGFNVRHFHEIARREHGVQLSYSFVKQALQRAGLVRTHRAPGRHRRRREPRACFGELLHLDGSLHPCFATFPRRIFDVDVGNAKQFTRAFAIAGSDDRRMHIHESALVEKLVNRKGEPAAYTKDAAEKVRTGTQVRDFAQKFGRVSFLLQRVAVIRAADDVDLVSDQFPFLAFPLRCNQRTHRDDRSTGGYSLHIRIVRQPIARDDLQIAKTGAIV